LDSTQENATVAVPVQFAPMTVSNARITITEVRNTFTEDYYCDCPLAMPAAIAEFGIPGVQRAPLPAALPTTCRTDLLQIDDRAVGVRILGSTAAAEARQAVDLQLCDPADPTASSTVAFPAGDHVVRSQSGKVTGIDFDRLVLGSDRTGAAMALGDRGSVRDALRATSPVQAASAPTVEVTNDGATKLEVKVTGAQPGTPFWLVLGQSQNTGWQATIDGKTRGDSTLVNGYANGWLVNPGSSSFSVTFDWTPQHQVWLAIWISAAGVLLCLFLALRGLRRRRRPHAAPDAVAGGTGSPDVDDVVDGGVDAEGEIALANPLVGAGTRPPRMAIILAPIATALVGWFVASWWVGLLGGLGVLAVLLERRLRGVLALGAPLVFASVALYIAVSQYRHNFEPKYFWPEYFDGVNDLAWLAVLLLGCDALVEILRTRRWRATPEPAVTGQEPDALDERVERRRHAMLAIVHADLLPYHDVRSRRIHPLRRARPRADAPRRRVNSRVAGRVDLQAGRVHARRPGPAHRRHRTLHLGRDRAQSPVRLRHARPRAGRRPRRRPAIPRSPARGIAGAVSRADARGAAGQMRDARRDAPDDVEVAADDARARDPPPRPDLHDAGDAERRDAAAVRNDLKRGATTKSQRSTLNAQGSRLKSQNLKSEI